MIAQLVERLTVEYSSVLNTDINWSAVRFRLARRRLVGPMDKATAYGAVDSGFESQAGLGPPFGGAPIKIGTIQRRLAWPLRKDDTFNRERSQITFFCSGETSLIMTGFPY